MPQKVIIIGAGFAGMSTACYLAKAGYQVTIVEKHNQPGGRARKLQAEGFTFDMGPSWYWMPDVFESFFNDFGKHVSDYYELHRLDPSYRIYWPNNEVMDVPANYHSLQQVFEKIESGSASRLDAFMHEAAYKYKVGIQKLVYKPGQSLLEFADVELVKGLFKLDVFTNMKNHVKAHFKHPYLQQLMEFPVLFLGALPEKTPALYSLMNYADIKGGTWYPKGGMYAIVQAMHQLATSLGVQFLFEEEVKTFTYGKNNRITAVTTYNATCDCTATHTADVVVASADYAHIDQEVLTPEYRMYSQAYWDSRVMAPSCLLYYVGVNKRISNILHHSLFFDTDFGVHGTEIYTTKKWPTNPLFYVSATSVTDNNVAPEGHENLFLLIPVATGLTGDTEDLRKQYFDQIMQRMEDRLGQSIREHVVYYKSYAQSDFVKDYHAFKGNAYGLANTLLQTAVLKPACKSKKLNNLFYSGQLTVPGPGVPPSLISGKVVANQVAKHFKN
ncbi:MAG TPA: phytoene desaturase [Chitinophagaceae bacterium]|nr:phytoene desaturase [Chitinophagaceae bacterium]